MSRRIKFKRDKFKKLVHYIAHKADPTKLGKTKMNKILWYSDIFAYLDNGKPITGETYIKRQFGPVSKNILDILDELVDENKIAIRDIDNFFGYEKKDFVSLNRPELKEFTAEEISLVDALIEIICEEHTAFSISEASHDRIWELAEIGEEIPYCAIFASRLAEIDEDDIAWAKEKLGKVA